MMRLFHKDAVARVRRPCRVTTVSIAHRPALTEAADLVYRVAAGRVDSQRVRLRRDESS